MHFSDSHKQLPLFNATPEYPIGLSALNQSPLVAVTSLILYLNQVSEFLRKRLRSAC
jgi:hypothetical protein